MQAGIRASVMFLMFAIAVAMLIVTGFLLVNKHYLAAIPTILLTIGPAAAGFYDLRLLKQGK